MENMDKIGYLILIFCVFGIKADSCIQCDSSNSEACVTLEVQMLARDCQDVSSTCYTRIKDGRTIRGCTSDLTQNERDACKEENNCLECRSPIPGCNFQKFPNHRLQCLRCEGTLNDSCATDIQQTDKICPNYDQVDKCVIYKSEKQNRFKRDCLSSVKDLCKTQKSCYYCEGNGCNYLHVNSTQIPNNGNLFVFSKILLTITLIFILFK